MFELSIPFSFLKQVYGMFHHKLKIKRRYIPAYKDEVLVAQVIDLLKKPNHPSLKTISEESNIPYGTIKYWNSRLKIDRHFVPGATIGKHRMLFTMEQEQNIGDFIKTQYIQHGIIIRRKHLRKILFSVWKSYDLENRQYHSGRKIMSTQFLKGFCKRTHLSFRDMRKKKRSIISQQEVDIYTKELCEIYEQYGLNRIANMDETPWNFVYKRGKVLSITGKEEVDAVLPDDYKKSFTVISTIIANGSKLPPLFLAKGKTNQCHMQFDGMESHPQDYEVFHSPGGNTDDETMIFYLHKLHCWMSEEHCALVLDRYASHVSQRTKECAEELGIRLVFIPTSATDKYHPLDKRVFGALKSAASKEFSDKVFEEHAGYTKPQAADLFIKLWKQLSRHAIMSAWDRDDEENEEDENEETDESESDTSEFNDD